VRLRGAWWGMPPSLLFCLTNSCRRRLLEESSPLWHSCVGVCMHVFACVCACSPPYLRPSAVLSVDSHVVLRCLPLFPILRVFFFWRTAFFLLVLLVNVLRGDRRCHGTGRKRKNHAAKAAVVRRERPLRKLAWGTTLRRRRKKEGLTRMWWQGKGRAGRSASLTHRTVATALLFIWNFLLFLRRKKKTCLSNLVGFIYTGKRSKSRLSCSLALSPRCRMTS
jgi:hypothetical protein